MCTAYLGLTTNICVLLALKSGPANCQCYLRTVMVVVYIGELQLYVRIYDVLEMGHLFFRLIYYFVLSLSHSGSKTEFH